MYRKTPHRRVIIEVITNTWTKYGFQYIYIYIYVCVCVCGRSYTITSLSTIVM
jgi:hypothetical protein